MDCTGTNCKTCSIDWGAPTDRAFQMSTGEPGEYGPAPSPSLFDMGKNPVVESAYSRKWSAVESNREFVASQARRSRPAINTRNAVLFKPPKIRSTFGRPNRSLPTPSRIIQP